jgi:uncharacterized membrane protein YfcA
MSKALIGVAIGAAAGFASGLLGIGGGLVMVPLAVALMSLSQHHAHATSLAAIVLIALGGAVAFGSAGEVDGPVAALLAAGALIGAPIGAALMARTSEARLKVAFGLFMVVIGTTLVVW